VTLDVVVESVIHFLLERGLETVTSYRCEEIDAVAFSLSK
jgi:hypothetical protein